ncbi:8423_t:CDS:2, partial [Entrophospora sp. SA101]
KIDEIDDDVNDAVLNIDDELLFNDTVVNFYSGDAKSALQNKRHSILELSNDESSLSIL